MQKLLDCTTTKSNQSLSLWWWCSTTNSMTSRDFIFSLKDFVPQPQNPKSIFHTRRLADDLNQSTSVPKMSCSLKRRYLKFFSEEQQLRLSTRDFFFEKWHYTEKKSWLKTNPTASWHGICDPQLIVFPVSKPMVNIQHFFYLIIKEKAWLTWSIKHHI